MQPGSIAQGTQRGKRREVKGGGEGGKGKGKGEHPSRVGWHPMFQILENTLVCPSLNVLLTMILWLLQMSYLKKILQLQDSVKDLEACFRLVKNSLQKIPDSKTKTYIEETISQAASITTDISETTNEIKNICGRETKKYWTLYRETKMPAVSTHNTYSWHLGFYRIK